MSREVSPVGGVHVAELTHHRIPIGTVLLGFDRLKEAAADDLKALVARSWPPLIGQAGDDVLEAVAGQLTIAATNLVNALRNLDQEQGVGHLLSCFC